MTDSPSLNIYDLDPDQQDAIDRLYNEDATLMIAGTGAGKTIVTLSALNELFRDNVLKRALVLAPLKVCDNVWRGEAQEWSHTAHLNVGIATGDDFDHVLENAERYDIVVVNFDMVPKLCESGELCHFDALVVDEGSKMAAGGVWFKKLRKYVKTFKWRLVMSATPIIEGWEKLFYQVFLCDAGAAFGRNKQTFLNHHFYATDFQKRNWKVIPGFESKITDQIDHLVHVVPDYKHTLPPFTVVEIATPLPPVGRKAYAEMCGTYKTEGVLAKTAAAKTLKLQQIASGFVYTEDRQVIQIHDAKHQALAILVEKLGKQAVGNILIVYQFVEELDRLRELYPDLVTLADGPDVVARWNAGKIPLLAIHPSSGSHGLNMALGGHTLIWLAPRWSLDQFTQQNERLWRRKQLHPVTAYVLVAADTVDNLVLLRHVDKSAYMPALLDHLTSQIAA